MPSISVYLHFQAYQVAGKTCGFSASFKIFLVPTFSITEELDLMIRC